MSADAILITLFVILAIASIVFAIITYKIKLKLSKLKDEPAPEDNMKKNGKLIFLHDYADRNTGKANQE